MRGGVIRACAGLLALAGCSEGRVDFAPDPPGRWRRGDLHVHATGASNDTGGDSFPEAIKAVAQSRGLDFVVLTDHSNSTGSDPTTRDEDPALFNRGPEFMLWEDAARLSDEGFIMVSGNELSPVADPANAPRGHIGCLPKSLSDFDTDTAFIDRPKSMVSGGDALAQARSRGCFTVVNHPFAQVSWLRYDWTDLDYDGIEVFNGGLGLDEGDLQAYDAVRCDQLAGRDVVPVGGSDNHRVHIEAPGLFLDSALGYPSTSVFVDGEGWPAITEGLAAGRVMLHEGASRLQFDAYGEGRDHAQGSQIRFLRVRGELDPAVRVATLEIRRATSCEDPRPASEAPRVQDELLFSRAVQGGATFDEAVRIEGEAGVYTAALRSEESHWSALSRVHRVP